jgi:Single-strand binding protein family
MSVDVILTGRLQATPVLRVARTGSEFVTVGLIVAQSGAEIERLYVSLIGFDAEVMAALLAHEKGDSLAVAGRATIGIYASQTAPVRPSVNVVVHAVMSPYFLRKCRRAVVAAMGGAEACSDADDGPSERFPDDNL